MPPSGARVTMRNVPPGRASSRQDSVVNPCGPHHCAACSGRVHALKTSSRGASSKRVTTSSRLAPGAMVSVVVATFHLLVLKFLQIAVQAIQALLPEPAVVLQPLGSVLQRFPLQPAGPPLRAASAADQAG